LVDEAIADAVAEELCTGAQRLLVGVRHQISAYIDMIRFNVRRAAADTDFGNTNRNIESAVILVIFASRYGLLGGVPEDVLGLARRGR
jgi:hypothetical protein